MLFVFFFFHRSDDFRVISMSYGATRLFQLRQHVNKSLHGKRIDQIKPVSLPLNAGDICTMEGKCQKYYQHRLAPSRERCGPRNNLTWRWIAQHQH